MEEKLYQYLDRLKEHHPVVAFIVDVIEVYLDRRVSRSSAELAYYLLMTLFPMLIMVISAVGWLPLDSNMVIAFLKSIIPAQSYDLIADYVTYVLSHQSSGLFLAGLIMSITASSAAFRSLLSISAEIYGRRTLPGDLVYAHLPALLRAAAGDGVRLPDRGADRQLVFCLVPPHLRQAAPAHQLEVDFGC